MIRCRPSLHRRPPAPQSFSRKLRSGLVEKTPTRLNETTPQLGKTRPAGADPLVLACGPSIAAGNRPLANALIVARRRAGSRYKVAVTKRQVTASEQWYSLGGGRVRGAGGRRPARSRLDRRAVAGSVWLAGRGWHVRAGLARGSGHRYRGSGHCHRGWVWGGGGAWAWW